ncbi:MAG: hypothetical protein NC824_01330 [Candidatus Omnitrophica bacterium]|nr:hypothetical protein [Candidatus Omnitrophota bacterium]
MGVYLSDIEREIKVIEKRLGEPITFKDKSIFDGWDRIVEKVGKEKAIAFSTGIAIPMKPIYLEATLLYPEWIDIYLEYQTESAIATIKEAVKHGADFILGGGDLATTKGPVYNPSIFIDASAGIKLKELRGRYGHRAVLAGNVDCAKTLVSGTKEDIEKEVIECIRDAGKGGGLILTSSNSIHIMSLPEIFSIC